MKPRNARSRTWGRTAIGTAIGLSLLGASSVHAAVSIGDMEVKEGDPVENTFVKIPITLSAAEAVDVTLTLKSFPGSGGSTSGDDFLPSNRTIVIPAGQTSAEYKVRVLNDNIAESTETFQPKIVSASGTSIADGTGLVTILDDDIPAGSITGSLGSNGAGGTITGGGADAFDLSDFFTLQPSNLINLTTAGNSSIDAQGFPNQYSSAVKAKTFNPPAMWPPASATDATSLPVPSYINTTNWVGATRPADARINSWNAGWSIKIHGNDDVWRFFGNNVAPGSALGSSTAPVADGSCPPGTTLNGTFSSRIGNLANDEAGLFAGVAGDYDVCRLARRYSGNVTLTNDNVYEIRDGFPGTHVGNGDQPRSSVPVPQNLTMNIEPGTLIFGEPQEALVITRGSRILSRGTREAPVVMTSLVQLQSRFDANVATPVDTGRGEWAGLALLGNARDNRCAGNFANCDVLLEGNVGNYGGNDDNDNSGILQYTIVRHAGNDIDGQGNELNGITFGGVGRATTVNYVQVHRGLDDGVEMFGGSVFLANLLLTGNADDSFDCDNGWTGGAQTVLIIQEGDESNRGIECDGNLDGATPITFPLLSNFTIMAPSSRTSQNVSATEGQGVLFREGMRAQVWNSIITGNFTKGCLDYDNNETFNRASEAGGTPPASPGEHAIWRQSIIDCLQFNFVENS